MAKGCCGGYCVCGNGLFCFRCDLRVISDANRFYIETILEHHGVLGCFSVIYTNPSFVDEEGRLRILPFHDSSSSPHGCKLCHPHMCKVL
jgi:pyridoxal phosphate phosphatase PHOSPHO2